MVRWSLRNAGRTPVVLAAVHGSLGLPGWRLFRGLTLLSPFSHSSPSLIGLLASVDVKQQQLTLANEDQVYVLFLLHLRENMQGKDQSET